MPDYGKVESSEHGDPMADNQIEELPEPESWGVYLRRLASKVIAPELIDPSSSQLRLLFACKGVRMFSFGFLAVMLVTYLATLGLDAKQIGLIFTLTLVGDAAISLFIVSNADVFGRRKMLMVGASLSLITSFFFALESNYWLLVVFATLGVISPSGNEVGPFMAIELSAIAQLTKEEARTSLMAWYNLVGSFSSALGALFCGGLLEVLSSVMGAEALAANPHAPYRVVMLLYAFIQGLKLFFFSRLGPEVEVPDSTKVKAKDSPVKLFMGLHKSKLVVLKLCALFSLDSFAGSLILQSIISHWFHLKFFTSAGTIGTIVFVCNVIAGISALLAVRISQAIGLILTMVVTHLPSNVLTILVPIMPTQTSAIIMLFCRYSISQMDVPTRNAFVQNVVDADERSAANGLTNVTRSIGASIGPLLAGLLFATYGGSSGFPFFIAGGLKIVYDLLLLYSMQNYTGSGTQSSSFSSTSEATPAKKATEPEESQIDVVEFSPLSFVLNRGIHGTDVDDDDDLNADEVKGGGPKGGEKNEEFVAHF
jgi:MFS family permease